MVNSDEGAFNQPDPDAIMVLGPPLIGDTSSDEIPHRISTPVGQVMPQKDPLPRQHKPLLAARRGGRCGPLSVAQKKSQKEARERGVCIRCRKSRIKVR